ncbi:capsular polysaccharide biosynthesis protein [Sphingomicrobium aestuariivivum]|uniref:capsular polysaccharide biosynthesis protein n=1 Tax=Sphingomicrobium aestuariivivum TaxID=1582356 RepID=UPI001FD64450|nr:hypothetical protein [Sphingomicrobium aestuariivivum]MCJ8191581.1 hypothetical protein [Sphingomicrobium aestuariivivum]
MASVKDPDERIVLAPSSGLRRDPSVAGLMGTRVRSIWFTRPREGRTVLGWGRKRSGRRAEKMARRSGADLLLLEDGFLRSVGRSDQRIGINIDTGGIYYDARSDSRLFDLIHRGVDEAQATRARAIAATWRDLGLSKYNDARPPRFDLPEDYVLVIDQVRNDQSISGGLAGPADFAAMLEAALREHPTSTILVKLHPDALNDPSKRHFDIDALAARERVLAVTEPCHIAPLIEKARAVYTVTSQVGFEALMWGRPVRCFGMPFYAGRGLTDDAMPAPEGRGAASLEAVIHAALVDYPRYWHPVRGEECEVEAAMAHIGLNRALRQALPPLVHAAHFSPWKRPFIRQFLSGSKVDFLAEGEDAPEGATLVQWGRRPRPEGRDDLDCRWLEDGFLRSVGLGADLIRPLSLVLDGPGIYYDATQPSGLETYLATHDFTDAERARAKALRERIVAMRLSKYNLAGEGWVRPETDKPVLLVVGQVASDASIDRGSPELRTSGALLKRVRELNPQAHILYKPHPDVVARLRDAGADDEEAAVLADEVLVDVDPVALIEAVDEVHVMTSLMGFEALLRGRKVTCYGLPFYAGWGLTEDRLSCERRGRKLALDELVHGALIAYPRYFSQRAEAFAAPEDILDELTQPGRSAKATGWRKLLRPLFRMVRPKG